MLFKVEINKRMMNMHTQESQEAQITTKEITLTPEAAEQIRLIRGENQVPETYGLRIGIRSGGCCGPSYLLAFDEKAESTDRVIQSEGVSMFVDKDNLEQLSGTTLEYVNGPQGKGFRFDNPNKAESCGCGDLGCGDGSCDDNGCGGH
jgi:iron-sulfur cluster assembly protein